MGLHAKAEPTARKEKQKLQDLLEPFYFVWYLVECLHYNCLKPAVCSPCSSCMRESHQQKSIWLCESGVTVQTAVTCKPSVTHWDVLLMCTKGKRNERRTCLYSRMIFGRGCRSCSCNNWEKGGKMRRNTSKAIFKHTQHTILWQNVLFPLNSLFLIVQFRICRIRWQDAT